jgi:hypothetical protein
MPWGLGVGISERTHGGAVPLTNLAWLSFTSVKAGAMEIVGLIEMTLIGV